MDQAGVAMLVGRLSTTRFVALAMVLGVVAGAQARGPLEQHWIPPESDWVVHVDAQRLAEAEALKPVFDALASSALGTSLADMGIDARMDLTCVTMFGTLARSPDSRGETTTMLRGGAALREAIMGHVESHDGYTLVLRQAYQADGKGIDAWTIDGLSMHVAIVPMSPLGYSAGDEGLVAILSDNADRLQACIGTLLHDRAGDGTMPSELQGPLADATLGQICPPLGAVVYGCAKNLNLAQPPLRSEMLAAAQSMVFHFGYREAAQGEVVVFAGLEIHGHDEADLDHVVASLNNMVEFWSRRVAELGAKQPAMLRMLPLIQACQVTREDRTIRLAMERSIVDASTTGPEQITGGSTTGTMVAPPSSMDR